MIAGFLALLGGLPGVAAFLFVVWIVKNAVMDVTYARNGMPNPRYELKQTKAAAAGRTAKAQPRYGTREWWTDFWADALEANTDYRRRKALERAEKRAVKEAERARGFDPEVGQVDRPEPESEPEPAPEPPSDGPAVTHDDNDYYTPKPGAYGWRCANCGRDTGAVFGTEAESQQNADAHVCPGPPKPDPTTAPTPEDRPDAQVIPFRPKEVPMSTTPAEVIGLDQSIGYAESLAKTAAEHGPGGNEGYIGHLISAKVTGEALGTAREMQEAFANAAAAAERHAAALTRQKSIQEQYDAQPDAGDKEFQTAGR